jgi:hypothetical protein
MVAEFELWGVEEQVDDLDDRLLTATPIVMFRGDPSDLRIPRAARWDATSGTVPLIGDEALEVGTRLGLDPLPEVLPGDVVAVAGARMVSNLLTLGVTELTGWAQGPLGLRVKPMSRGAFEELATSFGASAKATFDEEMARTGAESVTFAAEAAEGVLRGVESVPRDVRYLRSLLLLWVRGDPDLFNRMLAVASIRTGQHEWELSRQVHESFLMWRMQLSSLSRKPTPKPNVNWLGSLLPSIVVNILPAQPPRDGESRVLSVEGARDIRILQGTLV